MAGWSDVAGAEMGAGRIITYAEVITRQCWNEGDV